MEIPVLVRSLKSSILSSTSLQRDKTFWGVESAAVEPSRRKANMVAQGDGKFGPWGWPQGPFKPKKNPDLTIICPLSAFNYLSDPILPSFLPSLNRTHMGVYQSCHPAGCHSEAAAATSQDLITPQGWKGDPERSSSAGQINWQRDRGN